jgi:hypothetical protein
MISLQLRLPEEVRDWVRSGAEREGRSQNSQVVWLLRQAMAASAVEQQREETDAIAVESPGAGLPHHREHTQ